MLARRRLGRTELLVTKVGLGGAPIGRETTPEDDAYATVWAALEGGINLIDTAPHYGLGLSEARIGAALRERPDLARGCILSTKTGHYREERDYRYDRTLRSVTESMEHLGVDHLPIVHIHDVPGRDALAEILRTKAARSALRRLQEEGVVDAVGVGTSDLGVLDLAVESGEFDVLMVANRYNLLHRDGQAVIERALREDIGVLIAGVFATGVLAKGSADPAACYRYRPLEPQTRERAAELEALCARWGCSLPAAAVQFCLRGPVAGAAIVVGARTEEQIVQGLAAAKEPIPSGFWEALDEWLRTHPSVGEFQ